MRGSESDPHVRINAWNLVQQVREAQTSLLGSVDGLKAPAELGQLCATKLLLWRISVAVYILTQQSHLLHTLNKTPNISARAITLSSTPCPQGVLRINSEELTKEISVTYLIREHTDFLQYGADRSTSFSSSGEGNNTVGAHVVTTSHDGPTSMKDPKLQAASHQRLQRQYSKGKGGIELKPKQAYTYALYACGAWWTGIMSA